MSREETKLIVTILNEPLQKADAIVCLEGDENFRTQKGLELFNAGWAPLLVVSGTAEKNNFNTPAEEMAQYLIEKGVPRDKIIIESISKNTRGQAEEVMKIAKEKSWNKIILVASAFHQPRAFLTFLKVMQELGSKIIILNAPVNDKWFKITGLGSARIGLLDIELEKISEYQKKGHTLTLKQAIEYQKWKEEQT